ncbi:SMC-Scp complex subunit ScpB [Rhizobium sp. TRM95111]|uniref:SMC-Scp complex subunit ScpB n=1 Tax=Rhizobium alarense TaxID=2846851 RepID=UPI001F2C85E6|nr:SMC-Scp complex subunit ScpB [Rhizobium alarense]MCF3639661.1 SMC-Scp complex subunit ScpB [Rhizobium alarense]
MARRSKQLSLIDTELADLPPTERWREWMNRAEAIIFASTEPVLRATLAGVVGRECNLDLLIDDIRETLHGKPYDLVAVGGGWQHRTRPAYAEVVRAATVPVRETAGLSQHEAMVLMAIAYFQPVTRSEVSKIFGREISRDTMAALRQAGYVAAGPRSPTPGAPYTFVTTPAFLSAFGFDTLRDLPDIEMLEDAGLLSRAVLRHEDPAAAAQPHEGEESDPD